MDLSAGLLFTIFTNLFGISILPPEESLAKDETTKLSLILKNIIIVLHCTILVWIGDGGFLFVFVSSLYVCLCVCDGGQI